MGIYHVSGFAFSLQEKRTEVENLIVKIWILTGEFYIYI